MHPYAVLLARLALGSMWITAGAAKLAQKGPRGEAVDKFGLLPRPLARVVGTALPYLELALGLLLLAGQWTASAAAVSAALLLLFSLAIGINLLRGRKIECHCFGQASHAPISWLSVARNAVLLAPALGIGFSRSAYLALDGWWHGAALRPIDPPLQGFVPVLLLAMVALLIGTMAWEGRAVAAAARRIEPAANEARAALLVKEEANA